MASRARVQPAAFHGIGPLRIAIVPIVCLAAFPAIPWVRANPRLSGSIWGAVGVLVLLLFAVWRSVARSGRVLGYDFLPRPVHYVQLAMHSSIYIYWGWYWREV